MGSSKHRSVSLVDQKRLQWAKEKAELARIGEQFSSPVQSEKTCIRTFFSNMDISGRSFDSLGTEEKKGSWNQHNEAIRNGRNSSMSSRVRSPSLPSIDRYQKSYQINDNEEETSGYSSEYQQSVHQPRLSEPSPNQNQYPVKAKYYHLSNHASDRKSQNDENCGVYSVTSSTKAANQGHPSDTFGHGHHHKLPTDVCIDNGHDTDFSIPNYDTSSNSSSGVSRDVESYATYKVPKEGRAKWSDRASNDFYDRMSERDSIKSGPTWLQRCGSEFSEDQESLRSGSHLRGQNAPIDPNVLAERYSKRQKATEFQNAIRQQLQEREERRQRELERIALEEKREEERLQRQRQIEKLRLEEEQRQQRDKVENERRKHELMLQAIEKAELEAKLEKSKKKKRVYQTTADDIVPYHADMKGELELIIPKQINLDAEGRTKPTVDVQSITVLNDDERIQMNEQPRPSENGKVTKSTTHLHSSDATKKTQHSPPEKLTLDYDKDPNNLQHGIAMVLQTVPSMLPVPLTSEVLNNLGSVPYLALLNHQLQQQQPNNNHLALKHNYDVVPFEDMSCEIDDRLVGHWEHKDQLPNYSFYKREMNQNVCQNCEQELLTSTEHKKTFHEYKNVAAPPRRASIQLTSTTTKSTETQYDIEFKEQRLPKRSSSADVSTQTDSEFDSQSQNHHQRHYQAYLKEVTKMVLSIAEKLKKEVESTDDEKSHSLETTCTTTTTTTTVTSKSKKTAKADDRPKWGVNRPLVQYKKASDRDPFYVRNKGKIRQKHYQTSCQELARYDDDSQQSGDKTKSDSEDEVASNKTGKLQMVPIKTDSNGRIFLNFREASFVVENGFMVKNKDDEKQHQTIKKLAKIDRKNSPGRDDFDDLDKKSESCYNLNMS